MVNHIVHLELGVTNLMDGVKFYKSVFPNWKITKEEGVPDYYFCRDSDDKDNLSLGLGLVENIDGVGSIRFYVNVGDINESIQRITEAGGKVLMEKTKLGGNNGFISRFEDPFGNIIGIWSID